jgi:hypothetical protein
MKRYFDSRAGFVRARCGAAALVVVIVASIWIASPARADFLVPGTSNPWLAGMPDGTTAYGDDVAPAQSPVLVSLTTLGSPAAMEFTVTGSVNNDPVPSGDSPDGDPGSIVSHTVGAEWSKSDITAPLNSLLGVFLDDAVPAGAAPSALDFTTLASRNFTTLDPVLGQVFFIGDGLNSSAQRQSFNVPTGATRLFLGTMDGNGWNNNYGSFTVSAVPEPAALLMLAASTILWLGRSD